MGARALAHVLRPLQEIFPADAYPDLIVGLRDPDDAAVLRRSGDEAIVATADFFPPVVDDPADFGAIAAANAMSDVFAMGGEVLLALNLAAFPEDLPAEVVQRIIRAGAETVRDAGGIVAGGHTVIDDEPKFGLAVVGRVHPDRVMRKSGAREGDALLLTKAIGTGLVTTALKSGEASVEHVRAAVASMRQLNLAAGRVAATSGAHAVTDVTGFGLVGHAVEMARASGVRLAISLDQVPLLPGAEAYARSGHVPGGTHRNVDSFSGDVAAALHLSACGIAIAYDPQTSGGLLIAADPRAATDISARIGESGMDVWQIGVVEAGEGIRLTDVPPWMEAPAIG
jgi:selenide,water dikinase